MLLRSCAISAVFVFSAALGCGPVYTEAEFEPLSEAGSDSEASMAGSVASGGGGQAGQAGYGAGGSSAGAVTAGMPSAAVAGGGSGSAGASSAGGSTGEAPPACAALSGWQLGPYQLGQRVRSTCLLPHNGACPANETREFECQPPTGALGLGWCTDRQPGVVNGWNEAWIMHGPCPDTL